jgi:hypothetical protein
MKKIRSGELYGHLSSFLKSKGIEFKEGSYTQRVEQGCTILTDVINTSQKGIERAKVEVDRKLDQMRQTIHEKTAPKPGRASPSGGRPPRTGKRGTPRPRAKSAARPRP